jgi:hypothetical protein
VYQKGFQSIGKRRRVSFLSGSPATLLGGVWLANSFIL